MQGPFTYYDGIFKLMPTLGKCITVQQL